MSIKIALAGNPNCGKTTMFNALTGSVQYVGNWPGVTVEKKVGKLKENKDIDIIDLPGIYSLSPYTLEEVVTRNYLLNEKPDVIINIVDSTNIERNLYLTSQLSELGIPIIVALNMMDLLHKKGDQINIKELSRELGCEVVETSALKGDGCVDVVQKAIELAKKTQGSSLEFVFSPEVENTIEVISRILEENNINKNLRWYAIKLFERDAKIVEEIKVSQKDEALIETAIKNCEIALDDDGESIIINERYKAIEVIVKKCVKKHSNAHDSVSHKIDHIVTNRILALPIFAVVMFLIYYISVSTVGTMMTDWVNDVLFGEIIPPAVESFLVSVGTAEWLNSLILDGIIGGVGAVLGFLPQMVVLFFLLALLEDCGYMTRVAFIMDKVFRRFGLSGKSFIPMLIGTGCSVPGIMASRTIENERDRKMTIITTPFVPCSAKLPIIALIAGAIFPGSSWVAPLAYFIGVIAIVMSGIILKKTKSFIGDTAPFVMELPPYHVPSIKNVLLHVWDRAKSFIKKAGTVIFLASGTIWFLSSFSWSMQMVDTSESILASIGKVIAPIFTPLGFGKWEAAVATITGLVAKENVVSTFGVLFGAAEVAENGAEIWRQLGQYFTQVSAISFLTFNLLCAPCVAAIGAIKREMGDAKWTGIAIGYQTGFAYVISLIIFQIGNFFTGNGFNFGTIVAIVLIIGLGYLLFRPYKDIEHVKKNKRGDSAWLH